MHTCDWTKGPSLPRLWLRIQTDHYHASEWFREPLSMWVLSLRERLGFWKTGCLLQGKGVPPALRCSKRTSLAVMSAQNNVTYLHSWLTVIIQKLDTFCKNFRWWMTHINSTLTDVRAVRAIQNLLYCADSMLDIGELSHCHFCWYQWSQSQCR